MRSNYKYHDSINFSSQCFVSKYSYLLFEFKYELDHFNKLEPKKEKKKRCVWYKLQNYIISLLEIYFEFNDLSDAQRENVNTKYNPINLMLSTCNMKNLMIYYPCHQ